ncbi:hypothetical protein ABWH64_06020 [Pasteurella multocida]|uniref:hypothetical protein n=1 Tax=Pasteurella multocida TaxID=747 RepID=UPI00397DBB2C
MLSVTKYVGLAKAVRTEDNELVVFATNLKNIYGDVGYRYFLTLSSEQQDVVASYIALGFGAESCDIYSIEIMDEVLADLDADGQKYSDVVSLWVAPLNFSKI